MDSNKHWVGTWATAPAPSEAGVGFNNHTLRMTPRVSIGGDTLRVRVSNAYGNSNLAIGAAYVGIRDKGPAIVPGSERRLTFSGCVVDFDEALRDPERPTQMLPIYDCGDGLHPSDLGYCKMSDAIDLSLFD